MINKNQPIPAFSVFMKMRLQSFASLLSRGVFGRLVLFAMLVSTTTKVFPQTVWERYAGNPVLDVGPAGSWDDHLVGFQSVLFDDTTYHMWYCGDDGTNIRIGYVTSLDGVTWTKDTLNNPVLDLGPAGSWEDDWVHSPSVVFDGDTFHMWYTGTNGGTPPPYRELIGYATSPDGLTWTKDTLNNPVLDVGPPGSWDDYFVAAAFVRFDGDTFHMWYTGANGTYLRIGYATSPDGVTWTKDTLNNPVLDVGAAGSWDDYYVYGSSVVFDTATSTYKMWYTGGDEAWDGRIGYATSTVGIDENNPTDLPRGFALSQNYPNPFKPSTRISYSILNSGFITLKVYNIFGGEIQTLVSAFQEADTYSVNFDASKLSSGIYFYRLQVGSDFVETRKMLLMR